MFLVLVWMSEDMIKVQKGVNREPDSHFFEICDRLHELNEIDPISEEEIQAEIQSYKQEKRKLTSQISARM